MQSVTFLLVAVAILAFAAISGKIHRSVLTPPLLFAAFGFAMGPGGSGWLDLPMQGSFVHGLAELTLVLVLFSDASRIRLRTLFRERALPTRLLAIGMPLTIVLGTVAALALLPGLGLWEAAVLAAILAPTDAALGQVVVTSPKIPVRIRQTLNVESGLNDGIALPVVLVLLSCAGASEAGSWREWLRFAAFQVVLGPAVGIAVGWLGGLFVGWGTRSGWMSHTFQELSALGLALLAFAGAELVGGNGFLSAFVAGLTLGNAHRPICECLWDFAEAEGQLLTLLVFLAFGAGMLAPALEHADARVFLYALASLTIVRIVPVALSLAGSGLSGSSVAFLGWFGPRGIASILFTFLVLEEGHLTGTATIHATVLVTVALSILAHGLSAYPASVAYTRRLAKTRAESHHPEHQVVPELPVRISHPG